MLAVCLSLIGDEEDQISFETLYHKYEGKAYAIAYDILQNAAQAEDACADAFFSIARNFHRIRDLETYKIEKYVVLTVKNRAQNVRRDEKKHHETLSYQDAIGKLTDDVLSQYNCHYITECIKKLSDTDREILYLRIYYGLEYSEIAQTLGINTAAARKRLEHARKSLSKLLNEGEK